MTIEIYPASPAPYYVVMTDQEFKTLISEFDSGIESRRKLRRFSKRTFRLDYKALSDSERNTVIDFFRDRGGPEVAFWLVDWKSRKWRDEYVGRGDISALYKAFADDGGVFTDETTPAGNATANDITLLPAVPAENDAYYFGRLDKFDTVRINIGTAGVGTWTIAWEYWNGAWVTVASLSDGTSGFTVAGSNDVDFTKASDWVVTTVNSISAYWIRARVSAYTSITTQPKGPQAWYGIREYDLHFKTGSGLVYYNNGAVVTPTYVAGGGEASVDRIRFADPPIGGNLITSDGTGYLRIKGRFAEDRISETLVSPDLTELPEIVIKEVQW